MPSFSVLTEGVTLLGTTKITVPHNYSIILTKLYENFNKLDEIKKQIENIKHLSPFSRMQDIAELREFDPKELNIDDSLAENKKITENLKNAFNLLFKQISEDNSPSTLKLWQTLQEPLINLSNSLIKELESLKPLISDLDDSDLTEIETKMYTKYQTLKTTVDTTREMFVEKKSKLEQEKYLESIPTKLAYEQASLTGGKAELELLTYQQQLVANPKPTSKKVLQKFNTSQEIEKLTPENIQKSINTKKVLIHEVQIKIKSLKQQLLEMKKQTRVKETSW
jgi:hypothetical protein